jgi:DNA-binding transcriptional ArsR family regulator
MPNSLPDLNRVFRALADATRRTVLERLSRGPATVGELAKAFDMALPSFLQHIDVLEEAGLTTSEKSGRVRTCRLAQGALDVAEGWMASLHDVWARRADKLDAYLGQFVNRDARNETTHGNTNTEKAP